MFIRHCPTVLLVLWAFSCMAAPVKLDSLAVGPVTYSNVTVIGANATDLYFTHAQGIANVKLKYLNAQLQRQFHYEPSVAAEAERKQVEADLNYQSDLAARMALHTQSRTNLARKPSSFEESLADPISEASLLGKPGPALEPEKWLTDKPITEGKFVLVEFWAPWSIPCRKSIPDLNALQKKFADKLIVVGVACDSELENSDQAEPKLEFASAVDSKNKISNAAGVSSVPCVLLMDTNGVVRYQGHPAALTEKKLQALLARSAE